MKKKNIPQNFCHLVNGAWVLQNHSIPTFQQEGEEHLLQG